MTSHSQIVDTSHDRLYPTALPEIDGSNTGTHATELQVNQQTPVFVDLPGEGFVQAGMLRADCGPGHVRSATFEYNTGYLARPDAFALDPLRLRLPAEDIDTSAYVVESQGEIVGAIRDASPDGFGRIVMARAAGSDSDEFAMVTGSGTGRVGALAFGMAPVTVDLDIDGAIAGYDAFVAGDYASREFQAFVDAGSSFGGARPKAVVMHYGRHWLAKFPKADDDFDAIRVEAGVMRLAGEAGFRVPEVRVETSGDRHVFLIERFDRVVDIEGKVTGRIPFVSAMSATGHSELTARYGSYQEIAEACRSFGDTADVRDLFRRAAFNVLTGNDDDHLRNHGFLYDQGAAAWRLSPLYDVAPRLQTSSVRKLAIAMATDDRDRPSTLMEVSNAAAVFGLDHDEAELICEDLRAFVAANWERHLKDVGMPVAEVSGMAGCFAQSLVDYRGAITPK